MKTFFLILISCALLSAGGITETFKKTITIQNQTLFTVQNRNGNIEVTSWDKPEIFIEAEKYIRLDDEDEARKILDQLKIEITEEHDKISVKVKFPNEHDGGGSFLSWLFNHKNWNASVKFNIKVPKKMNLDIASTNGKLDISGGAGKLRFETTNGDIDADEISGSVNCYTTNGSVKVIMNEVKEGQDMSFKTTNGSVRLYMPATVNAELEAKTTNGSIDCDLPLRDVEYKSRKKLEGRINEGGPSIRIRTTNGSIKIRES